ncbi:MAG: hypothetical protein LC105_05650 [Chitinophagales bacterium]|nr:hypothetical protein [Chitinophagales bacterium]MCZ2393318.1 hypothetical protein [Chitinophagales bacterium]
MLWSKNSFSFFICICLIFASCKERKEHSDEIELKLKLDSNQEFITQMEINQSMESEDNGVISLIDQLFEFRLSSKVLKDSSDLYLISNTYQQLKIHQTQSEEDNEEVVFIDTDENYPPETELEKYYYQLKGKSYLTTINYLGDEISSSLLELNKSIGAEKFNSPFQKIFQYGVYMPEFPLKEKDVWFKEISFKDSLVSVSGNIQYQLDTWDDQAIYLSIHSLLKGRYNQFIQGEQIKLEQEGSIVLYRKSCWMKEANIHQKIFWIDENSKESNMIGDVKISSQLVN